MTCEADDGFRMPPIMAVLRDNRHAQVARQMMKRRKCMADGGVLEKVNERVRQAVGGIAAFLNVGRPVTTEIVSGGRTNVPDGRQIVQADDRADMPQERNPRRFADEVDQQKQARSGGYESGGILLNDSADRINQQAQFAPGGIASFLSGVQDAIRVPTQPIGPSLAQSSAPVGMSPQSQGLLTGIRDYSTTPAQLANSGKPAFVNEDGSPRNMGQAVQTVAQQPILTMKERDIAAGLDPNRAYRPGSAADPYASGIGVAATAQQSSYPADLARNPLAAAPARRQRRQVGYARGGILPVLGIGSGTSDSIPVVLAGHKVRRRDDAKEASGYANGGYADGGIIPADIGRGLVEAIAKPLMEDWRQGNKAIKAVRDQYPTLDTIVGIHPVIASAQVANDLISDNVGADTAGNVAQMIPVLKTANRLTKGAVSVPGVGRFAVNMPATVMKNTALTTGQTLGGSANAYASGGIMPIKGKGTGTSDEVPVVLAGDEVATSNGEGVVVLPAKTMANKAALEAIEAIIEATNGKPPVPREEESENEMACGGMKKRMASGGIVEAVLNVLSKVLPKPSGEKYDSSGKGSATAPDNPARSAQTLAKDPRTSTPYGETPPKGGFQEEADRRRNQMRDAMNYDETQRDNYACGGIKKRMASGGVLEEEDKKPKVLTSIPEGGVLRTPEGRQQAAQAISSIPAAGSPLTINGGKPAPTAQEVYSDASLSGMGKVAADIGKSVWNWQGLSPSQGILGPRDPNPPAASPAPAPAPVPAAPAQPAPVAEQKPAAAAGTADQASNRNGIVTSEMGRGFDPTKLTMAPGYGMASNAAGKTISVGPSQYVAADGSQTSRWEDTQAYKDAIARNDADKTRLAEMQSRRLGTDPMAIQAARQGIASALLANKAQDAMMQRNAYIQSLVTKAAAETDPLKQRAIIDTALAAQGKDSKHGKNLQVVDLGEYSVPDGIGGLKVVKRGQALYDADTKQVIPITPGQGGGGGGSAPPQSFASQAEAEAAQKSGRIKVGDVVIIGGKRFAVE